MMNNDCIPLQNATSKPSLPRRPPAKKCTISCMKSVCKGFEQHLQKARVTTLDQRTSSSSVLFMLLICNSHPGSEWIPAGCNPIETCPCCQLCLKGFSPTCTCVCVCVRLFLCEHILYIIDLCLRWALKRRIGYSRDMFLGLFCCL